MSAFNEKNIWNIGKYKVTTRMLLQDLADRIGCDYISDLKYLPEPDLIKVCIKELQADQYPVSEWNQALLYLTQDKLEFTSGEEAKQYIIRCKMPRRV